MKIDLSITYHCYPKSFDKGGEFTKKISSLNEAKLISIRASYKDYPILMQILAYLIRNKIDAYAKPNNGDFRIICQFTEK